jgi:hypothetical protein
MVKDKKAAARLLLHPDFQDSPVLSAGPGNPNSVGITVKKGLDVQFIDYCVFVPVQILHQALLHSFLLLFLFLPYF